ncbi:Ig-like domain-containing protein [Luteimonas panaciterrae]|uniref:Ig-like domain-containing protein n=1 Tax=Luteimonas panaciterrae TaxID=363885 RepID=UPI001CFB5353|nr:Ig-like domain-containing protein [Luteimonas panaciterrae]
MRFKQLALALAGLGLSVGAMAAASQFFDPPRPAAAGSTPVTPSTLVSTARGASSARTTATATTSLSTTDGALADETPTEPLPPGTGGVTGINKAIQLIITSLINIPIIPDAITALIRAREETTPHARQTAALTTRDQPVPIRLRALGPGGDFLADETDPLYQYKVVEQPKHGTLSGTPPHLVYTPNPGFTGFDRLKFQVGYPLQLLPLPTVSQVDIKVIGSYNTFESGQVRPLALNSDKTRLYAVNTPDNRLEIFDVTQTVPRLLDSVPVGLEPVAVSLRNDNEAWVVNTLSDSVSVVDLAAPKPAVKRTLQVGDEPQDIVFAGPGKQRAFIATAHRGQNSPVDPALETPGVGRADVWVFDAPTVDQAQGDAAPLKILTLFGMPGRALAVSPDGGTVYAAIFKSGNQTTVVGANNLILGPNSTKYGKKGLTTDASGLGGSNLEILGAKKAPNTGVIVQYKNGHWVDSYGTNWDAYVPYSLPDKDVFAIDANAASPVVKQEIPHVGTSLFNIAVNPVSGALYVSNYDARNFERFEGDDRTDGKLSVNGRFIRNQITVIKSGQVLPRNLNKHLVDSQTLGAPGDSERSLAMPLQMQVTDNGQTLYLAAYGSSKIGVFNTSQLENDSFVPSESAHINVSGGGPAGLVLDEARGRMYVLTRFNNSIAVVNTATRSETASVPMYNPEPDFVVKGRPFLYDARFNSAKGDVSCGSCHLFGDMDGLAWDLGNPKEKWTENPRKYSDPLSLILATRAFHPLKGPMTTQSFRGLEFQGPQHWRGDRTGAKRVNGELLEKAAFKEFRVAFTGLLARAQQPTEDQLNQFTDFIMQLRYPPNPIRNLDNSLTANQAAGKEVFFNQLSTGFPTFRDDIGISNGSMLTCNECHEVHPDSQRFGSSTLMSFEGTSISQDFKIPHFRNLYQKVGKFGFNMRGFASTQMGDQVSGFGFLNDGSLDTVSTFLRFGARDGGFDTRLFVFRSPADVAKVSDFLYTTDTGFAPIVGQQVTLGAGKTGAASRLDLLEQRALAHTRSGGPLTPECDLVASAKIFGQSYGLLLQDDGKFVTDSAVYPSISDADLRNLLTQEGNSATFTCAPPGSGQRIALDRDEDGIFNGADTVTSGRAVTTIQPYNNENETDRFETAVESNYFLEIVLRALLRWPDFTLR